MLCVFAGLVLSFSEPLPRPNGEQRGDHSRRDRETVKVMNPVPRPIVESEAFDDERVLVPMSNGQPIQLGLGSLGSSRPSRKICRYARSSYSTTSSVGV